MNDGGFGARASAREGDALPVRFSDDAGNPAASSDNPLVRALLKAVGNPPIAIGVNGGALNATQDNVVATIKLRDYATLFKLLACPELNFGNAYVDGAAVVEGDLVRLLEVIMQARRRAPASEVTSRIAGLLDFSHANTLTGSRDNIHHHYDLGNDFYKLWLDREMVYTCAYFPARNATLEAAQTAKLDYVCRKLRLRPGERVIEAGCGWGAFALHAAARFGAKVKAFNISREQLAYARERAAALGVQDRVEFIDDDYRNISSRCDAFVSIGMLEHVGRKNYDELGRVVDRCLENWGRGLIHSIGQTHAAPLNPWIEKRIFPGAYPPTLREMMEILEPSRMCVLDVENLRAHYALTLEHWLARFEDKRDLICNMYDESFVRAWRFYLSGSLAAFRTGELQLFQVLFNRPGHDAALTRDHLYTNGNSANAAFTPS